MVNRTDAVNKFENVSRIFKGYFILYDNASTKKGYVFNRIVDLTSTASQLTASHYGSFGDKKLAVIGYESEYTVRVDDTADLYPTDDIGSSSLSGKDLVSVSYFLDKMTSNELVPATFATVQETDATGDKYIVNEFEGFVTGAGHTRNTSTGTWEREFTLEVINVIKSNREGTLDDVYQKDST